MNIFSRNPAGRLRRSKVNLSHEYKMSGKMNFLYPVLCQEVLPSDGLRLRTEAFVRLAPTIAPVMERINVYMHYFFVPNRLLWTDWENFMTGGKDGTLTPTAPRINIGDSRKSWIAKGSLADYFGLPIVDPATVMTANFDVSALPFRAYQQIYNDYYIDKNLSPEIQFDKGSGNVSDVAEHMTMRKRAWNKDYFTSALPWTQRGARPSVPITGSFTPQYDEKSRVLTDSGNLPNDGPLSVEGGDLENAQAETLRIENLLNSQELQEAGITIEDLRSTARLQEFLEKMARGGSRYVEQVLEFFRIKSSDQRLQRAEYLGGGVQNVQISEVLNTAGAIDSQEPQLPQGNMAGHGISVGNQNAFKRSVFEEHGWVIGILSVRPKTSYTSQGINRKWQRWSRYDYFWKQFQNLGEQSIINEELYFDPTGGDNRQTFGYTPRYSDYRYECNKVTGDFRDQLRYWHQSRHFESRPNLNQSFIDSDASDRIFAVTDDETDNLYIQLYHNISALRPMSNYAEPKL